MVIFQIFKKQFLKTVHILLGSLFPAFTPYSLATMLDIILMVQFKHMKNTPRNRPINQ
jgi:hypothetical protein